MKQKSVSQSFSITITFKSKEDAPVKTRFFKYFAKMIKNYLRFEDAKSIKIQVIENSKRQNWAFPEPDELPKDSAKTPKHD